MVDKPAPVSGWVWGVTLLVVYAIGLFLYVGLAATPQSIQESLVKERSINASISPTVDHWGWSHADQNPTAQHFTKYLAGRFSNAEGIVPGQKGAVESVWDNTPYSLTLYGALLDYRIGVLILALPSVALFWVALMVDGWVKRKINMYRNSFSSGLRHTIGGRIMGIYLGIVAIFAFFLPVAIPLWLFVGLLLVKATGWWIWVVNLPKRM